MNFKEYIINLVKPYRGLKPGIYVLAISRFVNALGALIFPFMTLILSEKIGLNPVETGLYISITGLLFIPSGLLGGKLADHFGKKRTILLFEFLGMMTYVYCVFSETNMTMVYALMAASILFGFAGPAHDALVADLADKNEREGAYSLLYLGFNLGFAAAMILAGRLFANHLKVMFIIDVITALLALVLIAVFIKEKGKNNQLITDEENVSDGAIVTALDHSDLETKVEGSIFKVLVQRPIIVKFIFLMFLYRFVYSQWSFLMPLHTVELFGDEVGGALFGNLGTFNALIVVVFTALITRLLIKSTPINRLVIAGLLLSIGFGMLGVISNQVAFYISVFVFTLGEIVEAISTLPYLMNYTPESHRGRMSSVAMMIMGVGYSLSPLFFGWLLNVSNYEFSWLVTGIIGLIGTFGMYLLSRDEQQEIRLEGEKAI